MIRIQKKEDCCGCHACAQICPGKCIEMRPDEEGFLYPRIDAAACVQCGLCEQVCPILHPQPEPQGKQPAAYATINRDETVRRESSSGGVFTALAEQVLAQGGVVFGAAMTADQHGVHHIAVESLEGLAALRGSKYLQSTIGDTYARAKQALHAGRKVLFTGTPCQIEGLRRFLRGREEPNLLCVDLICHGVPSPRVWETYVSEQETCAGAPARRTFFRHKKYGWKTFALFLEFSNNKAYEHVLGEDVFLQAFLRNACLRPSCHACAFKKLNRASDITVADYWGVEAQHPEMDDDKGTSLVLVHSAKGQACLDAVRPALHCKPVELAAALRGNPSMTASAVPHRTRGQFFAHLGTMPFAQLVRRYAKPQRSLRGFALRLLRAFGLEDAARRWKRKLRRS